MEMRPCLSFDGRCEAAFELHARCLGGRVGQIFRRAGSPLASQVPADWHGKVMHASLTLGLSFRVPHDDLTPFETPARGSGGS